MSHGRRLLVAMLVSVLAACGSTEPKSARKKTAAKPAQAQGPSAPKEKVKHPILVEALIYQIDPSRDGDETFTCVFHVSKTIRGKLERYEKQFWIKLASPRRTFSWVRNDEFEGATVFLHMKRRRGNVQVVGVSKKPESAVKGLQ